MANLSGMRLKVVVDMRSSVMVCVGVAVERAEGRKEDSVGRRGVMDVNVLGED